MESSSKTKPVRFITGLVIAFFGLALLLLPNLNPALSSTADNEMKSSGFCNLIIALGVWVMSIAIPDDEGRVIMQYFAGACLVYALFAFWVSSLQVG